MVGMDLLNDLARVSIDPAILVWFRLVEKQQVAPAAKDLRSEVPTRELAYLKRIRSGNASKVLNGKQRSLFEERTDMNLTAIEQEFEDETQFKPKNKRKHLWR